MQTLNQLIDKLIPLYEIHYQHLPYNLQGGYENNFNFLQLYLPKHPNLQDRIMEYGGISKFL